MKQFLFILIPSLILASNSGIKLGINDEIVEFILKEAEKLGGKSIANINLSNDIYSIGKEANITNLIITNYLSFQYSVIEFIEPNQVFINFTNFTSELTFNFTEKIAFITDFGYGIDLLLNNNLSLTLELYESNGSVQLGLISSSFMYNNGTLELYSVKNKNKPKSSTIEEAEIYKILKQNYNKILEYLYEEATRFNLVLAGITKYFPFTPLNIMFDMSVTNDALIESGYLSLPLRGEVLTYPYRQPVAPFVVDDLPLFEPGLPFQIQVSDYVVEILATGLWADVNFNISALPASLPIKLTTDGLGFLIPGLKKVYGSGKNVTIGIAPSQTFPYVFVKSNETLFVTIGVGLSFYVVLDSTTTVHALDVDAVFDISLNASIELSPDTGLNFTGLIEIQTFNMPNAVIYNYTVPYPTYLRQLTGALLKTLVPIINALIPSPWTIPLPTPSFGEIIFFESSVTVSNGCLLLQASFI